MGLVAELLLLRYLLQGSETAGKALEILPLFREWPLKAYALAGSEGLLRIEERAEAGALAKWIDLGE